MQADNENEPFSFIHIAALTANVTRYLSEKKQITEREEGAADREQSEAAKKHPINECEEIERRLRQLAEWRRTLERN